MPPKTVKYPRIAEAVASGQPVYQDTTIFERDVRVANFDTEAESIVYGIASSAGSASGDYVSVITKYLYIPGATLTVGQMYYLLGAGTIGTYAEITSGKWITQLFRATTTEIGELCIKATRTQKP
jgi:hypothetical protein